MKKLYILLYAVCLSFTSQVFTQVAQLDVNFDNGLNAFTPIHSNADQPSFTVSVVDGVLKIVATKRAEDWSFLGMFGQNVNITALPTIQFSAKTTADVTFVVRVKSKILSDPANMETIEKSVSLTAGSEFSEFFFDLTEDIAAKPNFNPLKIEEIHIDCSAGWANPFTGTVEVDYLKIGFAKPVPSKGTGFVETFNNTTVPTGVIPNVRYTFAATNNALEVALGRDGRWAGFNYELDGSYDISANPILNVRIKTETDMILQAFLIDADGNGYQVAQVGTQFVYDELVAGKYEYRAARIYKGGDFITVSFDFSAAKATIVDLHKIAQIKFVSNGTALTFDGKFYIDEIQLGDQAVKTAYIGQLAERNYLKNSAGTKEVLIPEIRNALEINVSGASSLISGASVSEITYVNATEDGRAIKYGSAKLTYTIVPDSVGSGTLTLTAVGNEGFADNVMNFDIHLKGNNLPTIDPLDDMVVKNDLNNEVRLTGITSGDAQASQSITIVAESDNTDVVETVNVDYSSPNRYGKISFTAKSAGSSTITLSVTDDEDSVTSVSFTVSAYKSINQPPVIDPVSKLTLTNESGKTSILLTGIGDGDNSEQTLTIAATSNNQTVIPDPDLVFEQGAGTATLEFTPTGTIGSAIITISVTDNGGDVDNDGDKTTTLQIPVEVIVFNPTGLEFDMAATDALSYFSPENLGVVFFTQIVDTLGTKAMRVTMKEKWTYAGIWMDIPSELNLSALPVVSYEILSKAQDTWHWNYFYDAKGADGSINRNIQNSTEHQFKATADEWTTLSFDYRQPGDLNNSNGNPIDASRINALLINMHNSIPGWPFTNASGVFYIRNIKFGDKAVYEAEKIYASINPVSNQSAFENLTGQTIELSGISNGKNGTSNIILTAKSSANAIAEVVSVSPVSEDGTAIITYASHVSGSVNFSVKVEAVGVEAKTVTFQVRVLKNIPSQYAKIMVDQTTKHQTMRGFGTFQPESRFADLYATELGASVVRLGIIGNQWEPVNDNDDPNVTNMEGFNYGAFDWDYLRDLKAKGVETFILTSWSPPAWMKRNLSLDHKEQAIEWEKTDNILEPHYYEEFAESMAALVKAMKQEAGIDLLAIGLQNEPFFNEPYPSAILSGPKFVELIKIVGARFDKEGLNHVGFFMPEQVFGIGGNTYSCEAYLQTLKSDPVADEYCKFFAVHGYDATGITPGFPSYDRWTTMSELAAEGNNPKETWMSETYIGYSDWTSALSLAGAIHGSLWAGNITLWTNWSFDGTQVTKNLPNSSFYTSKNYFKYIRPGAVRVDSKADHPDLLVTAFENPDGKLVMVMINKGTTAIPSRMYGNNLPDTYQVYRTTLSDNCVDGGIINTSETTMIVPPLSVITLISENNVTLTMNQVADTTVLVNSPEIILSIEGISAGDGTVEGLTLEYENSNPGLIGNVTLSAIGADGKAIIRFTPVADQLGDSQIKLTLTNTEGIKRVVVFYVFVDDPGGLYEPRNEFFRIYPNPTNDQLNVKLSTDQYRGIEISDISGRIMFRQAITSDHFSVDVKSWNKGVYLIRLSGDAYTNTSRFIVD